MQDQVNGSCKWSSIFKEILIFVENFSINLLNWGKFLKHPIFNPSRLLMFVDYEPSSKDNFDIA